MCFPPKRNFTPLQTYYNVFCFKEYNQDIERETHILTEMLYTIVMQNC